MLQNCESSGAVSYPSHMSVAAPPGAAGTLVGHSCFIPWELALGSYSFTFVGALAEEILGYPLGDWYEPSFWMDHIHPEDRVEVLRQCDLFRATGKVYELDYRMLAAGGTVHWMRNLVRVVENEEGKRQLVGVMLDVTQHKQRDRDREEHQEQLERILARVEFVSWDWTMSTGRFVYGSGLQTVLGYEPGEMGQEVTAAWKEQIHPDDYRVALRDLEEHLEGKRALYQCEFRMRAKTGSWVWVLCQGKVVQRDPVGEPLKISGTLTRRSLWRLEESEALLRCEREILELIATQSDLQIVLESHARLLESLDDRIFCAFLLLDREEVRFSQVVGPNLPADLLRRLEGRAVADTGFLGDVLNEGRQQMVESIAADSRCSGWRLPVERLGIRACLGTPIVSSTGHFLGCLATFYPEPLDPEQFHLHLLSSAARIAALAIEQRRAEEDRQALQAQMQHAQKLESLGVMAGGVAHDFNNLLLAILGRAELGMAETHDESSQEHLREIVRTGEKAAEICRQMLAYSGSGRFVTEPLDLTRLVREMSHLLEVGMTKSAELSYDFDSSLPLVEADKAQITQVVMNLITNASDAINGDPGAITVRTGRMDCDAAYLGSCHLCEGLLAGTFVYLEVEDDGKGMDKETQDRLFDPFFTTKRMGRGLGMSAVLGIVRSHHGAIRITSQLGVGSTFRVLFPALPTEAREQLTVPTKEEPLEAQGTVLMADDEEAVLCLGRNVLTRFGFDVLTARDGREALDRLEANPEGVDMVMLDLTMPRVTGEQAFREIRRLRPDLPIILTSGYSEGATVSHLLDGGPAAFIQKPYRLAQLQTTIQQVMTPALVT